MKKTLITLCIATSLSAHAQHIKIKGTIIDEKKQPIEFVNISLGDENSKLITGTTSGSNGAFEISGLKSGNYKLTISSIGYKTEELWLNGTTDSRNPTRRRRSFTGRSNSHRLSSTKRSGQKNRLSFRTTDQGFGKRSGIVATNDVATRTG